MATVIEAGAPLESTPALAREPGGITSWPRNVWQFCRRKPLGGIGLAIVVVMLFCAVFVDGQVFGSGEPLLAPQHFDDQDLRNRNQDPSWSHWMGTDNFGRDIFSRILYGARTAMIVGFSTVIISASISLLLGSVSGYFGGWTDTITQRFIDTALAVPAIITLVFVLYAYGSNVPGWWESFAGGDAEDYWKAAVITATIGVLLAVGSVRVVRGATLSVVANQYVDAARTIGAGHVRILFRHIMPNVLPVVIVLATVQLGAALLASAAVNFLGLGIQDPFPDWGVMLSLAGSQLFYVEPLQAVWPGLAIALAVYGFNMLGDALRDVLDPRLRGGR
jgi:peptide/nickel transport system permease protein